MDSAHDRRAIAMVIKERGWLAATFVMSVVAYAALIYWSY
jgi:hypothetical protein